MGRPHRSDSADRGRSLRIRLLLDVVALRARSVGPREGLAAALLFGFFLTFGIPAAVIAMAPDLLMVLPHIAGGLSGMAWPGVPERAGRRRGAAGECQGVLVGRLHVFRLERRRMAARGLPYPEHCRADLVWRPYIDQVWRWGALYSEQTSRLSTGFIRTADWAGFQAALVLGAVVVLWKENRGRWKMLAWLLLSLIAVAAGWRFFPRYYFQLLPVMALLAARGYTLLGRYRAILLVLLLIPLVRFGPRYVLLANDLYTPAKRLERSGAQ